MKKNALNFLIQSTNADKVTLFRHQCEMNLARQFGAKFKNFTPDSCDFIFPNEAAAEAFEKIRNNDEYRFYKNEDK